MTGGNGKVRDEGLLAINAAFEGAKYLEEDAKRAADLMKIGRHRNLEISDAQAMELYAIITEGKKFQIERTNSNGEGYLARVESYADLADLFDGTLPSNVVREPEAANDSA